MKIPESMKPDLGAWNNGRGIDLESWIGCQGNFALAIGYASVFWPDFVEFEGFVLRGGFSQEALRGFATQENIPRHSVEWAMNHLHVADIQHAGCEDLSKDKILVLGNVLKQIYEAKLKWQFPDRSFLVELFRPDDEDDLRNYQISFWQA